MRSRSALVWLLRKEWRALMAASSWWVMLILIGPLVGVSFISATRTYAELSVNDAASGAGEAFSPLIGIWAPTFSACELAAAFLLPFVAIRVVAGDRLSGALKIELQQTLSPVARIGIKTLVLLAGWASSDDAVRLSLPARLHRVRMAALSAQSGPTISIEDVERFYRVYDAAQGHPTAGRACGWISPA